ncbi:MAG TPA: 3-deoxy-7-phosphoheptulonate synthase [Candidatus Omnitrophica bacterium]|nr:MAG: 3-deoxy-7-phosphoheptulonate synthase [Omnitrophica WOR_2 bacterium GWA2_63_20]OGX33303.1 MAG: 3-deoxy-7-phosphoheptulonate synthase [Omnitrophica WOR_2 bacterium RIFCSPHIGHO2_12_FULL_64_13]OGX35289.1 MAG: 3-deoxy-7-phosphoheptulonate synthase [Omnitrophica WOR_2 bacterium RIFCSPHIGHO2_02_FULL_63_39]OGX44763.1 MAG: 3-deoxy-7-phosphoheptulonate synthase [Omnitrophica WOR_2 bacterium RIFCSPLOWO2_02_FULL_63_16]OGX48374.1 MAG: 3-deoxy-7-phosphoheptulonate synthase [Omnitrophica WOR_2 bacter
MIIVMKPRATKQQVDHVVAKIKALGLKPMVSRGTERTIIGVIGSEDAVRVQPLEIFAGVEKVMPVLKPFKLVSREFKPQSSVIDVDGLSIGGKRLVIMAGPCSVENRQMLMTAAKTAKQAGAHVLRGGAFKPRTSPYSFQGLGEEALKYLREAADATGLKVVTEVMDVRDVGIVSKYADILQIGARNMQNFNLLTEAGQAHKPVLLKRGLAATITEFLLAAEYILSRGNFDVILCERGIRAFEDQTRFTLDLSAVPVVKKLSHLPIIVDPSHATGYWDYVGSMAKAAVAAGADGLIIEVHPTPEMAMSDGPQSLLPEKFIALAKELKKVAAAVGRTL